MLPPLFLDVKPHHRVRLISSHRPHWIIMIVPGYGYVCRTRIEGVSDHYVTKNSTYTPTQTAQLLEALHANDTITASSTPSGLLLANDSDAKRTHLLIHQSARLPSPALMVTNLDASNYPVIKIDSKNGGKEKLLFDRILCDVPCSGDGTLRKNVGIWKHWGVGDGNGLHRQVACFTILYPYTSLLYEWLLMETGFHPEPHIFIQFAAPDIGTGHEASEDRCRVSYCIFNVLTESR
jgi:multisite-specific tRNA:(cytosine-C5)-methyltransferase